MSGIVLGTPLAEELGSVVHSKIIEEGWSQEDDTSLAEYIVLMLVNGKTQEQIASELASELLQDIDGIPEFAQWLSNQVDVLARNDSSNSAQTLQGAASNSVSSFPEHDSNQKNAQGADDIPAAYDADMGDIAPDNAPRGPKGMHGGRPGARGGRIMGQMNKAMDRGSDSVLHRVRGQSGTERINSHVRGAPRGPRGTQNRDVRPGMQKALNGLNMPASGPNMQNSMMQNGGQQGQQMMPISTQQQMEFMAMMEQQARMMAQFMPGMVQPTANLAFQQNGQQQNGQDRSLFARVEPGRGRGGRGRGRGAFQNGGTRNSANKQQNENGGDVSMDGRTEDGTTASVEGEQSAQPTILGDPSTTMCRFNLRCINKDCPYVHQSPAAPEGVAVDMSDKCTFGVACKNSRCVGKHPSPAQIKAHQSEELCKFFPNCTNPTCGFKHPTMPICKNGANCTVEHCKFTHLQTPCRFKPCLNPKCPYKHEEGQKRTFGDYHWSADKAKEQEQQHVSERKFVTEDGDEELIRPEVGGAQPSQEMDTSGQAEEVITVTFSKSEKPRFPPLLPLLTRLDHLVRRSNVPHPSTAHVSFATIYEPAEDSFLLLDTLSSASESAWLQSCFAPKRPSTLSLQHKRNTVPAPLVLEVGTGSGVVLAFLAANARHIFGADVLALGTDVNGGACRATAETAEKALAGSAAAKAGAAGTRTGSGAETLSTFLASLTADLTTPLRPGEVDVLVFNPPYVPTETLPVLPKPFSSALKKTDSFAAESHLLSLSYAGGVEGMETTQRLLDSLPEMLSVKGVAYVLLCAQNRPEVVKEGIRGWGDEWKAETVGRSGKTGGWESLQIVRIWRDTAAGYENWKKSINRK